MYEIEPWETTRMVGVDRALARALAGITRDMTAQVFLRR